jgi:hypothetical protein
LRSSNFNISSPQDAWSRTGQSHSRLDKET